MPLLHPHHYQFLVGVFASVGSILYGYDLGVIAGVVGSADFVARFAPTPAQSGAVVSLFTGGAFFGAALAGWTGDWAGRRGTIFLGAVVFLLGGGLQTGARSIDFLYGGRVVAGLGVGLLTMIIPVYQSEIAHPSIRGRVTALQQFMLGIGSLVASWLTWGTNKDLGAHDAAQWRIPLGVQLVPAVLLAALILLFPESPRWLVDHGRAERGLQTLADLHAHGDTADPWVQAEFARIRDAIAYEHEHEAKSYAELFTSRSAFRRLFLACALQASAQMTGVSAIQYFSVDIFAQIGIGGDDALKYQSINSVLALLAQGACILTIDRFGRRWPLIICNLCNCVTFIAVSALLAVFPPTAQSGGTGGWGLIIMTWLYNISFSYGCGPLTWIIPAEIFDTHTRSKGVSIATMTSFAFNTMIGQVTDVAIAAIGWRYFLVFVVCNFTNAIFFWLFLPETKRLPLEEMNYLFTHAPYFVIGAQQRCYSSGMAAEVRQKGADGLVEGDDHREGAAASGELTKEHV